jgi:ribonuclease HI
MAIPIGFQTNHIAEASATLYGLSYAKSLDLTKVWLEGDSLNIINCLNMVTPPSWTIENIINKAKYIINSFEACVITHNYREVNKVADWVANVVCRSNEIVTWKNYDYFPMKGKSLIEMVRLICKQTANHDYEDHET